MQRDFREQRQYCEVEVIESQVTVNLITPSGFTRLTSLIRALTLITWRISYTLMVEWASQFQFRARSYGAKMQEKKRDDKIMLFLVIDVSLYLTRDYLFFIFIGIKQKSFIMFYFIIFYTKSYSVITILNITVSFRVLPFLAFMP